MDHHITARAGRALAAVALVALLLAICAGAALAGPQAARETTSYAATISDGRAAAQSLLTQSGASSLSLALVSGDTVVWQQGFGYADKATSTPPGADTMYGIGSVSKMLATVAAMRLVDQGKLELDKPVSTYLPAFKMASPAYRTITVRMLLDHSSGFPGSTYGDAITATYYPGYLKEMMGALAAEQLKDDPGYLSVYCNDGFTLIEALVPAVTGESFPEYVQKEILTPLGMDHTAYPLQPFADGTYAKVYDGDVAEPREVLNVLASGGAYSTPTDMSHLASMFIDGGTYGGTRILSAKAIADMGTNQTLGSFDPVPDAGLNYGLGWDTVTQPGLATVGVTGWVKGGDSIAYHAGFIVAPSAKLAVTVVGVAPLDSGSLETLGERILLHALVDQGTVAALPAPLSTTPPPVKKASKTRLAAMKGYWAYSSGMFMVTSAQGDPQALDVAQLTPAGWSPAKGDFHLRLDGLFHSDSTTSALGTTRAAGRSYLIYDSLGGNGIYRTRSLMAQKVVPQKPLASAWQSRVGQAWLAVNEQPDSSTYTGSAQAVLMVGAVPGLKGYVTVATPAYGTQIVDPAKSDTVGAMFLHIPSMGSRDLEDAVVERHGAEDWVWWGSTLYRPLATLPSVGAGAATVTFGADGYAEWRVLASAGTVKIGGATGTGGAGTGGATSWRLYDPHMTVLGAGTTFPASVTAPHAGCYLLLFGTAGSSTTVTVEPAAGAAAAPGGMERAALLSLRHVVPLR